MGLPAPFCRGSSHPGSNLHLVRLLRWQSGSLPLKHHLGSPPLFSGSAKRGTQMNGEKATVERAGVLSNCHQPRVMLGVEVWVQETMSETPQGSTPRPPASTEHQGTPAKTPTPPTSHLQQAFLFLLKGGPRRKQTPDVVKGASSGGRVRWPGGFMQTSRVCWTERAPGKGENLPSAVPSPHCTLETRRSAPESSSATGATAPPFRLASTFAFRLQNCLGYSGPCGGLRSSPLIPRCCVADVLR